MVRRDPRRSLDAEDNFSALRVGQLLLGISAAIQGDGYALLVNGPNKNGSWSVGLVRKGTPSAMVYSASGRLDEALDDVWNAVRDVTR
jgi:hypothetical protein